MKREKTRSNLQVPPGAKYKSLITSPSDVTHKHIDDIAEQIENGLSIQSAAVYCGVDYDAIYEILNVRTGQHFKELSDYAKNAFKIAEVNFEKKLTAILLNKEEFNHTHLKMVEKFLEIVSPRFSRKNQIEHKYDLYIILETFKPELSEEAYKRCLKRISDMDPYNVVSSLDAILMDN